MKPGRWWWWWRVLVVSKISLFCVCSETRRLGSVQTMILACWFRFRDDVFFCVYVCVCFPFNRKLTSSVIKQMTFQRLAIPRVCVCVEIPITKSPFHSWRTHLLIRFFTLNANLTNDESGHRHPVFVHSGIDQSEGWTALAYCTHTHTCDVSILAAKHFFGFHQFWFQQGFHSVIIM